LIDKSSWILVDVLDGVPTFPYPASDTFLAFLAVSSVSPKDIVSSIVTVQEEASLTD
jgi:hypothetical protein